jgi:hypothetical protein
MRRGTRTAVVAAAVTAAGALGVGGLIAARRAGTRRARVGTRQVITVYRPFDELTGGAELPAPLTRLGDAVEIELRPAPGDRGTEISVRLADGTITHGAIRRALRESRSLLETGDVLLPSGPPTTKPTLLNRPLRAATAHGREGGLR